MHQEFQEFERLKPLTTDQYDRCRQKALARVQARIGVRPERKHFEREYGAVTTILDWLALIVFGAALVISSVHIITHMGTLANSSYETIANLNAGTVISRDLYVASHQWGTIFLSESAMILFMVLFALGKGWRRWLFLSLAATASVFVIIANWQSNIGLLESIMPPVFTIGVGLNMERIIVQTMKRRKEVTQRYLEAMSVYETSTQDARQHPDYLPMLRQEVWQKLVSLKSNQHLIDASPEFKRAAVQRELARDTWAYDETDETKITLPIGIAGNGQKVSEENPLELPILATGNGHSAGAEIGNER